MTECGCESSGSISKYYLAKKAGIDCSSRQWNLRCGGLLAQEGTNAKILPFQVIEAGFTFCCRKVQGIRKWYVWFFLIHPSHLTNLPASWHRLFILCEDKAWKDAIQKARGGEGESRGCRNRHRQTVSADILAAQPSHDSTVLGPQAKFFCSAEIPDQALNSFVSITAKPHICC